MKINLEVTLMNTTTIIILANLTAQVINVAKNQAVEIGAHRTVQVYAAGAKTGTETRTTLTAPDGDCLIAVRSHKLAEPDQILVVGDALEDAATVVQFQELRREFVIRAAMKRERRGRKAPKLQRTSTLYFPKVAMSNFVVEDGSVNRFSLCSFKGTQLPEKADLYLAGLGAQLIPELHDTNALTDDRGMLNDQRTTGAAAWPAIMVEFDLIDEEYRRMDEYAKTHPEYAYDPYAPLTDDSMCGRLWAGLLARANKLYNPKANDELKVLTFKNADGSVTEFEFVCQSAAWAKAGRRRAMFMNRNYNGQNLATKWWDRLLAGMDLKSFVGKKGVTKPFYYGGLMFTGLTRTFSFEEMRPWWERTVVVADAKQTFYRDAIVVKTGPSAEELAHMDGYGPRNIKKLVGRETIEFHDALRDGASLASPKFFEFLQDSGLEASFTQCRMHWGKGVLEQAELPKTGKVKDIWGEEHDWADIDVVLTTDFLKAASAFKCWKHYLESTHTGFGWCQPATNSRTTNGQCLDTMALNGRELGKMAAFNIKKAHAIMACAEEFNSEALELGIRCLAQEGLTPEKFANLMATDRAQLAKRIVAKVSDWERGRVRGVNTKHFEVPKCTNRYLAPDLGAWVNDLSGSKSREVLHKAGDVVNGVVLTYDEVCDLTADEGLLLIQRNPSASASNNVVVMNRHMSWAIPGMLHVAAGSRTAGALGGADFDGDQVLVCGYKPLITWASRCEALELDFARDSAEFALPSSASLAEMQNYTFQAGAQFAAAAMEPANIEKLAELGLSQFELATFFDAYMQLGVDAGKGGLKMPAAWESIAAAFRWLSFKLPAWKYSKDPETAWDEAAAAVLKDEGGDRSKVTSAKICEKLTKKFALAVVKTTKGESKVYDPQEYLATLSWDGTVKVHTERFLEAQVIEALPLIADLYPDMWTLFGDTLAEVGYDESNNA